MLSINTQVHSSGLFSFPILSAALKPQTPPLPRGSLVPSPPCHCSLLVALLVGCSLPGSPSPTPDAGILQGSCLRVGSSFTLPFRPSPERGNAYLPVHPSPAPHLWFWVSKCLLSSPTWILCFIPQVKASTSSQTPSAPRAFPLCQRRHYSSRGASNQCLSSWTLLCPALPA